MDFLAGDPYANPEPFPVVTNLHSRLFSLVLGVVFISLDLSVVSISLVLSVVFISLVLSVVSISPVLSVVFRCCLVVLDEADTMLEGGGFLVDTTKIVGQIRPDRQTLLFRRDLHSF